MMKILRSYAALILASLGISLPGSASTFDVDYTDLWYASPAESQAGWGVNVIQQNEVLFVTLFVFGPDNTPHWYVASNVNSTGINTFSGQLFNIGVGSYFGAPWTGISGIQAVGNIAFTFATATIGTMVYTVNNVQIAKNIVRQGWRNEVLTGNYIGGTTAIGSACGGDGSVFISGVLLVTHNQPNITMTVDFLNSGQPSRCTYNGTYSQVGSLGAIDAGTYSCNLDGNANALFGTFSVSEMRSTRNGFNGRIDGTKQNCSYSGYFGGIRDVF